MKTVLAVTTLAILLVGLVVIPNLGSHVEAKSKTGKIAVTYADLGGYAGKAKIKIWNEETGKTLVKADINFAKLRASQGDNCCHKTYEFKWKGNSVGDELGYKISGGGGSWSGGLTLEKGTTKLYGSLDEIGCGDECD